MRIVAGNYRSRIIQGVDGDSTRPTLDKVKEAIFSRIGPYFDGGCMLDLFAGSGNMSFEAISRGITQSYMIDSHPRAIQTIKKNMQTLQAEPYCVIMKLDYKGALQNFAKEGIQFDLVYLDPPYKKQQISSILHTLDDMKLVKEGGNIVCESLKEDSFEDVVGELEKVKDVTYGITRITYYKRRNFDE